MIENQPTTDPLLHGLTTAEIIEDYTINLSRHLPQNLSILRGISPKTLVALIESAKAEAFNKGYLSGLEAAKDIISY